MSTRSTSVCVSIPTRIGMACESGEMIPWVTIALATRIGFAGSLSGSWESCPSLKNRQSLLAHESEASLSLIGS